MRRPFVASAILAALLTMPLIPAAILPTTATAPTDAERATAALRYLWAAQLPDGSLDHSLGETADFVIGAADAGYDPATLQTCAATSGAGSTGALDFLATASDGAATDPAKTGKAVLAVVAAGEDPADFQGRDLLARITAQYHSGTGAYGNGSTFTQSFAFLGLKAAGRSVPAEAVAELKALQGTDGSWSYGTSPVPAGQGDTNSTAIAMIALHAAGDGSADTAALAYLATQQLDDGGFPYQNASTWGPPASDPDSDAIVIQAMVAVGVDPEAPAWTKSGGTVLTNLRSSQGADGGFDYQGFGESALTTSQIPAALLRLPYGAAAHPAAGRSLPAIECPSPSASDSAGPSGSASVSPSGSASVSPSPSSSASSSSTVRPTAKPTARPTARPTAKPTAHPTQTSTAQPADQTTPAPTYTPAAEPTPEPTASPSQIPASPSPALADLVAGLTSEPAGPAPGSADPSSSNALIYGIAALLGLAGVVAAGWFLMLRPGRR